MNNNPSLAQREMNNINKLRLERQKPDSSSDFPKAEWELGNLEQARQAESAREGYLNLTLKE